MADSTSLSAKSLRVGMTIHPGNDVQWLTIRKITPLKSKKGIRLFWKASKNYWDVNYEAKVDVQVDESGKVTFDKEVRAHAPAFEVVTLPSGSVSATWVNPDDTAKQDDALAAYKATIISLERQIEDLSRALTDANRNVAQHKDARELVKQLETEKTYSLALENLVLTHFSKSELLSMYLGRQ